MTTPAATLADVRRLGSAETGLATVVTLRADGSAHASLVNAGVLIHPVSGGECLGFVTRGVNQKIRHLRRDKRITVSFRSGWEWVTVEGLADLIGPADELVGLSPADTASLIRTVYSAAVGGEPDDWRHVDSVIASEGHTAVLVRVVRIYGGRP